MKTFKVLIAFSLWVAAVGYVSGQTVIVGLIYDAQTKEPLPGENLSSADGKTGVVTDAYGRQWAEKRDQTKK